MKDKLRGNKSHEQIYNEGLQFYQDFFVDMKLSIFMKLQQYIKGEQVGIKYIN